MATLFDAGFIGFLTPIFIFLFIFVLFFALMEKLKFFGEKAGAHALIAFCLAMLFIFIPETRDLVNFVTPWFVVLVLFGLLIIVGLMFLGYKEEEMIKNITEGGTVIGLGIVAVCVLFLTAITKVFGSSALESGGKGFMGNVITVIFNPKVLGIIFILVVAAETIRKVGYSGKSKD